jgi:hypothetical protein
MPGVIELLFLGSYLPTFKERYPDPEGPARDGGSRSQNRLKVFQMSHPTPCEGAGIEPPMRSSL